jgi:HEAT repeat protein
MSDENGPPMTAPPLGTGGRSDASVVTQFFLLPLAVVAGLVGVFLLFTMATRHPPMARDHLKTLGSGRFNQRWQAAFELSNLLRDGIGIKDAPAFLPDLVRVFRKSAADPKEDPRVRRYLALALGNSGSREAVSPLMEAVRGKDSETRLYGLWGLSRLGAPEAEPAFREGLKDEDPSIRSISAYGLGILPGSVDPGDIEKALLDPVAEVGWNAALALARRGNPAGERVLEQLLDRKYLDRFPSMDAAEKSATILNALRAIKYLKINGLDEKIRQMAESDPDRRVREAALACLEEPGP